MPEELVIAVIILVVAIWLVVKVFQGIASAADAAAKSYGEAAANRRQRRYAKGRDRFSQYVRVLIPEELDRFHDKLTAFEVDFKKTQGRRKWVARPPDWRNEPFRSLPALSMHGDNGLVDIRDIDAILTPNTESSTWLKKESALVSRNCKYPFAPPINNAETFTPFPKLDADLKLAVLEASDANIKKKDLDWYFSGEQMRIVAYNRRRADLMARSATLNAAIDEWNSQSRIQWESYVAEHKKMAEVELLAFKRASDLYTKACCEETNHFKCLLEGYQSREKRSVIERLNHVLDSIRLPSTVPRRWEIDFDHDERIAVVEIELPDLVHKSVVKTVVLKSGPVQKPLSQTERKEFAPKIHPAILLRTAYEVFRNDADETIRLLVLNGWVRFDDPATGTDTKAYTASLMVTKEQVVGLNLSKIDPLVAFDSLHGKSAGKLIEIIPIEPALSLNRKDSRFVDAKEVLKGLGAETNLASMDWQDFEHLIRELFEKEFSGRGAEVKITQASRDRGVDAIVFDPDPIHGGKYVIQAKRYTHTVDVSAVRDLCAVVRKEGASRGILVTTSTYGADAYAFANNEPVTLLSGAELLGLLKKHGYTFRINLDEARRLL